MTVINFITCGQPGAVCSFFRFRAIWSQSASRDQRQTNAQVNLLQAQVKKSSIFDIAEYFGSEALERASMVRYMQLKHSTLHATEPWTASGLEKTIKGFCKRYRELLQTFSADALATKLQFWFVTNRPIGKDFAEAVNDAAAEAQQRHPSELQKLERFTGLRGVDLAAFLKLLHLEDCQDGYWDQRNILVRDMRGYLPDADADGPLKLKELVTRRALSEGEKNPTITKMDVLRALDTDESSLFPAPCLINSPDVHNEVCLG